MPVSLEQQIEDLRALPLPWEDQAFVDGLAAVLAFSEYGAQVLRRYPDMVASWWRDGARRGGRHPVSLEGANSESEIERALRLHRHRDLFAILWHDVNGLPDTERTLADQSALAEYLIQAALAGARQLLANFGTPRAADGRALDLVVFGLGKLGGRELNFSSDVDLVYAFAEAGETDGKRSLPNETYFIRLGALLTRLLSQVTPEGFCYRVDLRLRPFGEAGRLALSATAMEQYFQREGRDWERYAWVKARVVAGDQVAGQEILDMLRPFVYRRYLDYGAFDALREMKALIRAEVRQRELRDHVKLGSGGIREIEFFAQAFQLMRGGRERKLRQRPLLAVLEALVGIGEASEEQAERLREAYLFYRRLENRFQQVRDQQTHVPPTDPEVREAIARSLDFPDWASLFEYWCSQREYVRECFDEVFEIETEGQPARMDHWQRLWQDTALECPDGWQGLLDRFRNSGAFRALGQRSRLRLDRLMPRLLNAVAELPPEQGAVALERVLRVITAIARRSSYLALLSEQDEVLGHLVALCGRSPWLTDRLCRHPLLLDELIDRRGPDPDSSPLAHLERRLESAAGDLELEMEILREVRDGRMLNTAMAYLSGKLDATETSLLLTALADAVLEAVYRIAWRDLTARHGRPGGKQSGLAIIGYGTLGGRELTLGSDLDLIFLYAGGAGDQRTRGERPLPNPVFYTRLCQRILHLITTSTPSGKLYEVDTRLRPNGRAGLLVSSLAAFADYQRKQAWTWELQALTRARWVAGAESLRRPFEAIRGEVVARDRDPRTLSDDVATMRERMRAELDSSGGDTLDLKQGPGGRVDLEFLTQYARLRWAGSHPQLLDHTRCIDTLTCLGERGLLTVARAQALVDAYSAMQQRALAAALDGKAPLIRRDDLVAERTAVLDLWCEWLVDGSSSPA